MDETEQLRLRAELQERQRQSFKALGLERPGVFLHAVHLQDMPRWNNFVLAGWHVAPGWAALDPAFAGHENVREVSIERLRQDPPVNVTSPFAAMRIYAAALIRRGKQVGLSVENTKWMPSAEEVKLLRSGDIELDFEAGRRRVAPDAASRLASLFVADDSPEGQRLLREMFGNHPDLFLLKVRVPAALRFTRADTRWFEAYWNDPRRVHRRVLDGGCLC